MGLSRCNDFAQVVQTLRTTDEGRQRFVPQGREVRVVSANVRGVADDQVKALGWCGFIACCVGQRGPAAQPVGLPVMHRQAQPLGIESGHSQCIRARIHGPDLGLGAGLLDGQGDGAAARAQVEHGGPLGSGGLSQYVQCPVHQAFGIGSGVQHAGIDL